MKPLFQPPDIVKKMYRGYQWDSVSNKILITFDDGPDIESTPIILEKLDEKGIKSVFFCVGKNIARYPHLIREISARGHVIGNHSLNHESMLFKSRKSLAKEIELFNGLLSDAGQPSTPYFRPPRGRFNPFYSSYNYSTSAKLVMWSLLPFDYKNDINIVKFGVSKYLNKNSIVVLHDSIKSKNIICETIDLITEKAAAEGFELGGPSECLR